MPRTPPSLRSSFPDFGVPVTVAGHSFTYRIHDRASGELLYVGCTVRPLRRFSEHKCKAYKDQDVRFDVDRPSVPTLEALRRESAMIVAMGPRDNVSSPSRRFWERHAS